MIIPVACPPCVLWHVRVLSIIQCLYTQLQGAYWKLLKSENSNLVIFPGVGAIEQLKIRLGEGGIWAKNFQNFKCQRVCLGGGGDVDIRTGY